MAPCEINIIQANTKAGTWNVLSHLMKGLKRFQIPQMRNGKKKLTHRGIWTELIKINFELKRSKEYILAHVFQDGPVAQWIRHLTTNQGIPGSNPGGVVHFWMQNLWRMSLLSLNWRAMHLCTKTAKADEICSAETFPQTLTLTWPYGSQKSWFYPLEKISIIGKAKFVNLKRFKTSQVT